MFVCVCVHRLRTHTRTHAHIFDALLCWQARVWNWVRLPPSYPSQARAQPGAGKTTFCYFSHTHTYTHTHTHVDTSLPCRRPLRCQRRPCHRPSTPVRRDFQNSSTCAFLALFCALCTANNAAHPLPPSPSSHSLFVQISRQSHSPLSHPQPTTKCGSSNSSSNSNNNLCRLSHQPHLRLHMPQQQTLSSPQPQQPQQPGLQHPPWQAT